MNTRALFNLVFLTILTPSFTLAQVTVTVKVESGVYKVVEPDLELDVLHLDSEEVIKLRIIESPPVGTHVYYEVKPKNRNVDDKVIEIGTIKETQEEVTFTIALKPECVDTAQCKVVIENKDPAFGKAYIEVHYNTPDNIYFLPTKEEYTNFATSPPLAGSQCVSLSINDDNQKPRNVFLVYDFAKNTIQFQNSSKQKKDKWVASIHDAVTMRVVNINTHRYTVEINSNASNLNIEAQNSFLASFQLPESGVEDISPDGVVNSTAEEATSLALDSLEMAAQLLPEMKSLYDNKLLASNLDMCLLEKEMQTIVRNIGKFFNMQNVTEATIKKKADELLTRVGEQDKEKALEYVQSIKQGAEFLARLNTLDNGFTSYPVQPKHNDILTFDLTIKEGETVLLDNRSYDIDLYGGWKVDYSTGLFFTGLQDNSFTLKDTTYTELGTEDGMEETVVTKKQILQDKKGDFSPHLGAMAHFYYRSVDPVSFGFAIGAVSDLNANIRFMLGGSAIIGSRRRLSLNSGLAFGRVERLGTGLKVKQFISSELSDVPTLQVARTSWFLSLTFNFGGSVTTNP